MSKLRRSVRQVFITEKGKSYKMSVEQKETCRLERVWVKCLEVARGISWCNDIEKLHQCRDNLVEAEQRFSEFYKSCRETTTDLDLECMLEEHSELMSKLDERLEVVVCPLQPSSSVNSGCPGPESSILVSSRWACPISSQVTDHWGELRNRTDEVHPVDPFHSLDILKNHSASVAFCRNLGVYNVQNGAVIELSFVVSVKGFPRH